MKLKQLAQTLDFELLTNADYQDCDITGGYCGDLLSWVMGKASAGNVWITMMSNVNIVAVASLTEAACILLSEDTLPEQEVLDKANEQGIVIFRSSKTSYQLAAEVFQVIGK